MKKTKFTGPQTGECCLTDSEIKEFQKLVFVDKKINLSYHEALDQGGRLVQCLEAMMTQFEPIPSSQKDTVDERKEGIKNG